MNSARSNKRRISRTGVITAAAIAGVVVASGAAIAANMGILSASDNSDIGSLAATGDLAPAPTQVVDVYVADPASTTTAPPAARADPAQAFTVDAAGTVSVIQTADGLRLGDVVANAGWTWTAGQTDASTLKVTLTNGIRTLEFDATLGSDGTIAAAVNEPIGSAAPSATNHESEHEGAATEHEGYEEDD